MTPRPDRRRLAGATLVLAAAALLERLDVEPTSWIAELLVGDGRNERALRQLELGRDADTVPSEQREAIGAILGTDGPVGSIGLRFRPRE